LVPLTPLSTNSTAIFQPRCADAAVSASRWFSTVGSPVLTLR